MRNPKIEIRDELLLNSTPETIFLANKLAERLGISLNDIINLRAKFNCQKNCEYCHKPFLYGKSRKNKTKKWSEPRFCSYECYLKHKSKNHGPLCKTCGIHFCSTNNGTKYCSPKCKKDYDNKKERIRKWKRLAKRIKRCLNCNKIMIGKRLFCSSICRRQYRESNPLYEHICKYCKKKFSNNNLEGKFCSKECLKQFNRERENWGSTSRIFATFIIELREQYREIYLEVRRRIPDENKERFDKRLSKFNGRINQQSYREGHPESTKDPLGKGFIKVKSEGEYSNRINICNECSTKNNGRCIAHNNDELCPLKTTISVGEFKVQKIRK